MDATILIPTHDHAALLPYAIRSALDQEAAIELFVIGDGVGDDTRAALAPFLSDPRVRFFDNPKGERHGEAYRHVALQDALGEIVTYLSDDDILLPDHVREMRNLLADAEFAHPPSAWIGTDGLLGCFPFDAEREECRSLLLLGDENSIGLTGASHTLALYRRLPHGWRPAPAGVYTDWHMWRQVFSLPNLVARTGRRLTCLHFPSPMRSELSMAARVEELERWSAASRQPDFEPELAVMLGDAIRLSAEDARLTAARRRAHIKAIESTRVWRLRERLVALRLVRALRGQRP